MIRQFKIKAKKLESKRTSNLRIHAYNEQKAIDVVISRGYNNPISIEEVELDPPSREQIEYAAELDVKIPEKATMLDVYALISRKEWRDSEPNEELKEFATGREIAFSEFIGKKSLYSKIFDELLIEDKIAFFVFSVYRWLSDDRGGNLDNHNLKRLFYEFADNKKNDDQFLRSLLKYNGSELRFFGTLRFDDGGYASGGSERTIAYKESALFLNNKLGLQKTKVHTIKGTQPKRKKSVSNENTGCLVSILLIAAAIFYIIS